MNVLMFHSVGNETGAWNKKWLSVSLKHFEKFCGFLTSGGYQTVHLDEWYRTEEQKKNRGEKQVVLTFDDGYLDNWVYAYPILRKYKLKGTVFINPEFIDSSEAKRFNLNDALSGKCPAASLQTIGFLNWQEIKEMQASGTVDIQSHGMSHNYYFAGAEVVDIYRGQEKYEWLAWLAQPKRKPFYLNEDQSSFTAFGYPIFRYDRSLSARRYFPDERLVELAVGLYKEGQGEKDVKMIVKNLNKKLRQYPGRAESDKEMEKRYRYELSESKNIIEKKLNKKVEFLCWPGGRYNSISIEISKEAGYKASTVGSSEKYRAPDNSGDYKRVRRIGMSSFINTRSESYLIETGNFLIEIFKAKTGNFFYRNLNRTRKLAYIIKGIFK